jgi:hypothetical protein
MIMQPKKAPPQTQEKTEVQRDPFLAERDLRQFCFQAGQELGQLLGAILGELNYALSTANPSVRDRSMAIALSAAEKALHLSANLRYYSGPSGMDARPTDLAQLLLDTVELLESELQMRGIRLSALAETPASAALDAATLRHLLTNLILKMAESLVGGGDISLTLKRTEGVYELSLLGKPIGVISQPPMIINNRGKGNSVSPYTIAKSLLEAQGGTLSTQHTPEGYPQVILSLPYDPKVPVPESFENRRQNRRVRVQFTGEVIFPGHPPLTMEVCILSEKGAYLVFPRSSELRPIKPNQKGSMKIFYFDGQAVEVEEFRIASLDPKGPTAGVGVEFLKIDNRARAVLAALVRSHTG